MGDDSERLHLEGLDEATERERWEEHFAGRMTDLPDAETAWEAFIKGNEGGEFPGEQNAFLAGFAAASGPWAEQLDAAKAEPCEMPHPSHPEWLCERPKGHDAHRRPGDAWCTDQEAWVELQSELTTLRVRDEHYEILLADNLRLRAELDNLRNRVSGAATMSDIWEELEHAQAAGLVSVHDADEVRNFAAFLEAAGPRSALDTPEGRKRFGDAWREHYPEDYAKAVAEAKARKTADDGVAR